MNDFYQPGHTYMDTNPCIDWLFRVDHVTTHPENGEQAALGWRRFRGEWQPYAYFADDWDVLQFHGRAAVVGRDEEKGIAPTATVTPEPLVVSRFDASIEPAIAARAEAEYGYVFAIPAAEVLLSRLAWGEQNAARTAPGCGEAEAA
ncbi:hypothetical protein RB200_19770 [Streptomyces sp. PmtG]